jgi:hypothetical protein
MPARPGAGQARHHDEVPAACRLSAVGLVRVQSPAAAHYGVDSRALSNRRRESIRRDAAEWLSRQLTYSRLRELAAAFGVGHAEADRNLTRRR